MTCRHCSTTIPGGQFYCSQKCNVAHNRAVGNSFCLAPNTPQVELARATRRAKISPGSSGKCSCGKPALRSWHQCGACYLVANPGTPRPTPGAALRAKETRKDLLERAAHFDRWARVQP